MKKTIILFAVALLLLLVAAPAFAAPPDNNPGKAPDDLERIVFVHFKSPAKASVNPRGSANLYSYSGYKWSLLNLPVKYWINPANSPVANAGEGITAAFQTWQDEPTSNITFSYLGTTTSVPGINVSTPDYKNVVGWADLSASYPDAIAITVAWSRLGSKLLVDCDTVLNLAADFAWFQTVVAGDPDAALLPDTPAYDCDVQNIMVHEAGHWLMLNDLYKAPASAQTLYGYAGDRELKKRSLESGDIAGVRYIYP